MNILVLLCGGLGSRISTSIPKQFYEINNKPIFLFSLEKFLNNKNIDCAIIVASKEWHNYIKNKTDALNYLKNIYITDCGLTGLLSAFSGFQYALNNLKVCDDDIIIFHDSARPLVDDDTINNNIDIAAKYSNAVASISLSETLIKYDDNKNYSNMQIDRDNIKRVLTPHSFKVRILKNFFNDKEDIKKSKYPSIFAYYMSKGNNIYFSDSSERNFKITYDNDLKLAIQLLSK